MKEIKLGNVNKSTNDGKSILLKKKFKSRVVVFNDNYEILIANYGGVYMLPGGSIEKNEKPEEAAKRELSEEVGIEIKNLKPLCKIVYNQLNYPSRDNNVENRQLITYYFYMHEKINEIGRKNRLTEKEKKDNFNIKFYSTNDIYHLMSLNENNNPRKHYFDNELKHVIEETDRVINYLFNDSER